MNYGDCDHRDESRRKEKAVRFAVIAFQVHRLNIDVRKSAVYLRWIRSIDPIRPENCLGRLEGLALLKPRKLSSFRKYS